MLISNEERRRPFPSGIYLLVCALNSTDPLDAAFLAGLHRRLLPGALVVMVDDTEAHCRTTPISERNADGDTFRIRRLVDGSTFRVLKNFPTESELVAATGAPLIMPRGSWLARRTTDVHRRCARSTALPHRGRPARHADRRP
jgi:hypothetical protein